MNPWVTQAGAHIPFPCFWAICIRTFVVFLWYYSIYDLSAAEHFWIDEPFTQFMPSMNGIDQESYSDWTAKIGVWI